MIFREICFGGPARLSLSRSYHIVSLCKTIYHTTCYQHIDMSEIDENEAVLVKGWPENIYLTHNESEDGVDGTVAELWHVRTGASFWNGKEFSIQSDVPVTLLTLTNGYKCGRTPLKDDDFLIAVQRLVRLQRHRPCDRYRLEQANQS